LNKMLLQRRDFVLILKSVGYGRKKDNCLLYGQKASTINDLMCLGGLILLEESTGLAKEKMLNYTFHEVVDTQQTAA